MGTSARRGPGQKLDARVRVAIWAAMASAIFWTLAYQHAQIGANIPEFVYVNF